MSDPNQPPSSPEQPDSSSEQAKDVAKGAAIGCLAGFGALGAMAFTAMVMVTVVVIVGFLLLYLACSGH